MGFHNAANSIVADPPATTMANEPTPAPQAFAPIVSRLTDALSLQLSDAFAETQSRADRERAEAVAAAVAAEAEAAARELAAQRAALDAQVASLRDDYDARVAALGDEARDECEALETRLRAELTTAVDAVRHDADARVAEVEARAAEAAAAAVPVPLAAAVAPSHEADSAEVLAHTRIVERELALAASARLLTAFERLDAAHSLRDTLDALVDSLASEVARVLVFVVRGDGLRGWRFAGVAGAPADAVSVAFARTLAGPLAPALARGAATEVQPSALAAGVAALSWVAPLGEAAAGMAVPLVVDGQTVALVYCDDGQQDDRSVPAPWPEMVQVLVRHASRCLEAHTARRAAGFPRPVAVAVGAAGTASDAALPVSPGATASEVEAARRFARLVVSELKLYNEAAVEAGREARDLRVRLRDELARARRLYEARVPATLPMRDDYFDQEVVRTLADGDPALLGDAATSAA